MADKYQCTAIRSHLVNHINDDWPKDLEAWVELDIRDALHRENYYFDKEGNIVWPGRILPDPAASLRFFKWVREERYAAIIASHHLRLSAL